MNKDTIISEKPMSLPELLEYLKPGNSVTILNTAYKVNNVRSTVFRMNRKLKMKAFSVSEKDMNDGCRITRIA